MISKWRKFRNLSSTERRVFTRAAYLLPLISIGCTFLGYRKVQSMLSKRSGKHPIAPVANHNARAAEKTGYLTDAACRLPFYRFRCLVRSMVLWHLLNRQGLDAKFRFGVNKEGTQLKAHAWVEHDGVALGESANLLSTFAPLLDGR